MILLKLKRVLQLPSKSEKNNFRKLFYFYRDEEDDKETELICAWAIVGAFHEFISSWNGVQGILDMLSEVKQKPRHGLQNDTATGKQLIRAKR